MKIIENRFLPPRGFLAINILGIMFIRKGNRHFVQEETVTHEGIHTEQMKELLYVFFYFLYAVEYIIRLFVCRNRDVAYRSISFEQEAYNNEGNVNYRRERKRFAFVRYIFKIEKLL
jgi:hypothetical protein